MDNPCHDVASKQNRIAGGSLAGLTTRLIRIPILTRNFKNNIIIIVNALSSNILGSFCAFAFNETLSEKKLKEMLSHV